MGFGIKTKAKKIFYYIKHPTIIYGELTSNSFPKSSYPKFRINSRLAVSLADVYTGDFNLTVGVLRSKVNRYAVEIYRKFVLANPNNIGNWSIEVPIFGTRQLEYEVIQKLINLYKGKNQNLEGYITSGGTEGNLYSVWVGKTFVTKQYDIHQICLLKTNLTHYSIDKACLICSIKYIDIPLNQKTWSMDPIALEIEIKKQINKGVYGFIISLTFGYSETGTCDDLKSINTVIQKLKRRYKKLSVSIIIDAAFNGLIEPFITNDFRPFISKDVHVFSTDFSKFTAIPYPAGAVLYRKQLRKIIERKVPVFPMPDNTLLGSRPGASVAAIWGVIHHFGISGYKKIINNQIKVKDYFINKILKIFPNVEIINDPHSLVCGIIINKKNDEKFSDQVENKYLLYAKRALIKFSNGQTRNIRIYKFFFLPHITKRTIDEVILSIKNSIVENN